MEDSAGKDSIDYEIKNSKNDTDDGIFAGANSGGRGFDRFSRFAIRHGAGVFIHSIILS